MAANNIFQPVTERGFWLGFSNLFAKENNRWWGRRRWWIQIVIWTTLLNGILAALLFVLPQAALSDNQVITPAEIAQTGIEAFFSLSVLSVAIGSVILALDAIIQEKQTGTAEWLLSKPVSRSAFFLSKLFSNIIGITLIVIVLQAMIAYAQFSILGYPPNLKFFLEAISIVILTSAFYLSLTLLLGVVLNNRGAILGICLGLLFGGQLMLNFIPELMYATPFGFGNLAAATAVSISLPPEFKIALFATAVWALLFNLIGIWQINRLEV